MSASEMEWAKAKADSLIRQVIDKVGESIWPTPNFCKELIQMAYTAGLIGDVRLGYWQRRLELAVAAGTDRARSIPQLSRSEPSND